MPLTTFLPRFLRRRLCAGLAAVLAMSGAHATIRYGDTPDDGINGDGSEVWFSVYDSSSQLTYTLDLGLYMNAFFASGQDDAGYQRFWVIDPTQDAAWNGFATRADLGSAQWGVYGVDAVGLGTPGQRRWFITGQQGSEGLFANLSNNQLQSAQANAFNFLVPNNLLGTHPAPGITDDRSPASYAVNGSGLHDAATDPTEGSFAYLEANGLGRNAFPVTTNRIGQSSWFYYLTRSGSSNLASAKILVDEFDNLGADGYWGFAQEQGSSRYLLSYTLPRFVSALEVQRNVAFGNSFAHMAGVLSVSSAAGKGDSVLSLTEGFLRGLASDANASAHADPLALSRSAVITPVPEPGALSLGLLGAGALWLARRRRLWPPVSC